MPRRFNYRKVASAEDERHVSRPNKSTANEIMLSKKSICEDCKKRLLKRGGLPQTMHSGPSASRKRSYSSQSITRGRPKKRRLEISLKKITNRRKRNRRQMSRTMNSRRRQLIERTRVKRPVTVVSESLSDSVIEASVEPDTVISVKSDDKTGDGLTNLESGHEPEKTFTENQIPENSIPETSLPINVESPELKPLSAIPASPEPISETETPQNQQSIDKEPSDQE